MTFGTWRWWGCQPHTPAAFTPRRCSWYSFSLGAESTPGPWCGRKEYVTEKSSDTTGKRSRDLPTSSAALIYIKDEHFSRNFVIFCFNPMQSVTVYVRDKPFCVRQIYYHAELRQVWGMIVCCFNLSSTGWTFRGSNLHKEKTFSFIQNFQTGPGVHPASYLMGSGFVSWR
jgi:hypothetical protein